MSFPEKSRKSLIWSAAKGGIQGSRFKVQGSKFKVQSSRFKVQGSRFKVQGSKSRGDTSEELQVTDTFQFCGPRSSVVGQLLLLFYPLDRLREFAIIET